MRTLLFQTRLIFTSLLSTHNPRRRSPHSVCGTMHWKIFLCIYTDTYKIPSTSHWTMQKTNAFVLTITQKTFFFLSINRFSVVWSLTAPGFINKLLRALSGMVATNWLDDSNITANWKLTLENKQRIESNSMLSGKMQLFFDEYGWIVIGINSKYRKKLFCINFYSFDKSNGIDQTKSQEFKASLQLFDTNQLEKEHHTCVFKLNFHAFISNLLVSFLYMPSSRGENVKYQQMLWNLCLHSKGFEYKLRLVWIQSKSIPFDAPTSMRIKTN